MLGIPMVVVGPLVSFVTFLTVGVGTTFTHERTMATGTRDHGSSTLSSQGLREGMVNLSPITCSRR